jgi:hypothetical protein
LAGPLNGEIFVKYLFRTNLFMTQLQAWLRAKSDLIKVISKNKKWHMSVSVHRTVNETGLAWKPSNLHFLWRPVELCKVSSVIFVLVEKMRKITREETLRLQESTFCTEYYLITKEMLTFFRDIQNKGTSIGKIRGFHGSDYEECLLLWSENPVRTSQETHYVSATEISQLMLCKIWGFHGCDYEECRLLGYRNPVRISRETHYLSAT